MKEFLANLFFKNMLLEVKNDNYNMGYRIGYEKGYNEGHAKGEVKGKEFGYLKGFDEGSKGGIYINSNGTCISNGRGEFKIALSENNIL
jgi:hypothetical protein